EVDDGLPTEDEAAALANMHMQLAQLAAEQDCRILHNSTPPWDDEQGTYCPRVFDGWSCWPDTTAGTIAYVNCPEFIVGFHPQHTAHRVCNEDGTWFTHPQTNMSWSNYTTCVDVSDLENMQIVNQVYIAGYSISLVALCISLFIFCFFRSLKCTRVNIHKNLFVSFIINNAMWLIWYKCVLEDTDVLLDNTVWCQLLHMLVQYFMVANYFWMFCEGLYLHTLLVVAFVAEDRIMKWFIMVGWMVPVFFATIYAICRSLDSEANKHCWHDDTVYSYILTIPVVVSLVLNLAFLINIVRVLVTKLRAVNTGPNNNSTRKAVRATLILIPLLGLHYIIVPFRPDDQSPGRQVYLIFSALVTSLQGLGVSLLFCFFNGEVLSIFKKKWNQHKLMRGGQPYGVTTFSSLTSNSHLSTNQNQSDF
ncbi:unnamed protein product, partial [Meganyctiphanes norvegica]